MGLNGQILRGVKIAAYVFAGLLLWAVARDFLESTPEPDPVADSDPVAKPPLGKPGPSTVPPPPPLPGHGRTVQPAHPGARTRAESQEVSHIRGLDETETPGAAMVESGGTRTASPAPGTSSVSVNNEPGGVVIVVPPVRTTQESRGRRWVKAVGRVLHIGGQD